MKNKTSIAVNQDYQSLLQELKSILSKGQYQAVKAFDNIRVQTYWQLGERIFREELKHKNRADYGKFLIENLAVDLEIDKSQLHKIIKFYRCYEIVATVSPLLSWSHYVNLIKGDKKKE